MKISISLEEATLNKIDFKLLNMTQFRKNIIAKTNTFKEFKLLKTELMQKLLEYENDFRLLSTIIKSFLNQNFLLKENSKFLKNEKDTFDKNNKILIEENYSNLNKIENLERNFNFLNEKNIQKENIVKDFELKIFYLENIIKDYQKNMEII